MSLVLQFHNDVLDFHRAMDLTVGDFYAPSIPDEKTARLRRDLIEEETWETVESGLKAGGRAGAGKPVDQLDAWEQTIDGLCDSMYVAIGAAITFGIRLVNFLELPPSTLGMPPFHCWKKKSLLLLGAKRVACEAITSLAGVDEVAPALAGLVATVGHVAAYYGIPLEEFWKEVQRANMAKVGGPVREDGKRLKPPGWVGPNHLPLIRSYWPALVDLSASS